MNKNNEMEKDHLDKSGYLLLKMPEEVDHCSLISIRNYADQKVMKEGYHDVIFDFQDTKVMDSSGIGIILGRYRLVNVLGGDVYITNANERIKKIIMAAGLGKIVRFIN